MNLHLTAANALAMRMHLAHDNERLRDALRVIADMAEHHGSALAMTDIARIARAALVASPRENPSLRHPEEPFGVPS